MGYIFGRRYLIAENMTGAYAGRDDFGFHTFADIQVGGIYEDMNHDAPITGELHFGNNLKVTIMDDRSFEEAGS